MPYRLPISEAAWNKSSQRYEYLHSGSKSWILSVNCWVQLFWLNYIGRQVSSRNSFFFVCVCVCLIAVTYLVIELCIVQSRQRQWALKCALYLLKHAFFESIVSSLFFCTVLRIFSGKMKSILAQNYSWNAAVFYFCWLCHHVALHKHPSCEVLLQGRLILYLIEKYKLFWSGFFCQVED